MTAEKLLGAFLSLGGNSSEPSFPRLRLAMMNLALGIVRMLFSAKMGYDLWKLKRELDDTEERLRAMSREKKWTAAALDESKLEDDDDDGEENGANDDEEKNDKYDLDERLKELEQQRLNALRCCTIAAGFNILGEITGDMLMEPSARLLLTTLFAVVWNVNPKILLHFYDNAYVFIVARFESFVVPVIGACARHAAFAVADATMRILKQLGKWMDARSLEQLSERLDDCHTLVRDTARKRNLEELKAAAMDQEVTPSNTLLTEAAGGADMYLPGKSLNSSMMDYRPRSRRCPRQSSVF